MKRARGMRLPSFGEEPINGDMYSPGAIPRLSRFQPTLNEEAEESTGSSVMWDKEWAMPKPVKGIPGDNLVAYNEAQNEFRKMAKERVFRKLRMIPTPMFDAVLDTEIVNFGRLPVFGLGTLGQYGDSQPERGPWGELWSALVTGATSFLETQTKQTQAQTIIASTVPSTSITQTSTLIPLIIIGGILFMMMKGKRGRLPKEEQE